MIEFTPKYITFDCYGTLTSFGMAAMTREMFADRIPPEQMELFVKNFASYRLNEVLGAWQPYVDVICNALERTCKLWKIKFNQSEALSYYEAVPTWGPHADVAAGLSKIADKIPLVILSNAANDQIQHNVDKLGAHFPHVYTAEQAQAYKPRLEAFEYMLDQLGCGPEQIMHVSSSFRYDHMSAADLGFGARVLVNRSHEPSLMPHYATHEIKDIGGLSGLLGL